MQPIRLLFRGSAEACSQWVGIAKKWARQTFKARIRNKTYQVGDATIRVENLLPTKWNFGSGMEQTIGGSSKVWIEAGGGLWYQFITTGPTITYDAQGSYGGSAVAVKLPVVKPGSVVDFTKVKPIATGSTIEELPTDPPTTATNNTSEISRVKYATQLQLITEPVYRNHKEVNEYKNYSELLYSWSSIQGIIFNYGVFFATQDPGLRIQGELNNLKEIKRYTAITDKTYDMAPSIIVGKKVRSLEPDMDWPQDAMRVSVESVEYGTRTFIVSVDASSCFRCWSGFSVSDTPIESPYSEQLQRITVENSRVKIAEVPFPDWVHIPTGNRRDTDWPIEINSGEPRYVWRFHPQGTKVVGIVISRTPFYTNNVKTVTFNIYTQENEYSYPNHFVDLKYDGEMGITYEGVRKVDFPGYVEFSISIEITGPEYDDFDFSMTLLRQQQTDENNYIIAADYLSPIYGGWTAQGISANPGDLVVMNLKTYFTDTEQSLLDNQYYGNTFGYNKDHILYARKTAIEFVNLETVGVVLSVVTKDFPEYYEYPYFVSEGVGFPLSNLTDSFVTHKGVLSSIDLSKLTFILTVEKKKFTAGTHRASYYTPPTLGNPNGIYYSLSRLLSEADTGIRFYVFGRAVHEERKGVDLSVWQSFDALNSSGDIKISPFLENDRFVKMLSPDDGVFGNHYIEGFPVGYEIHHKEWFDSIQEGIPKLIACPEGYYSGCVTHCYTTTGKIAEGLVFSFDENSIVFSMSYSDDVFYDGNYTQLGYPNLYDVPNANQFSLFNIDVIGHVSGAKTSHKAMYEQAFQKTYTEPTPTFRVVDTPTYSTNLNEYRSFKYEIDYLSNGSWVYATKYASGDGGNEVEWLFHAPRLNGSMLFSK